MWVCHISRWAWDTGGRAPNVGVTHISRWAWDTGGKAPNVGTGMPHQQMGMGHWWEAPNVGILHQEMGMGHIIVRYWT